MSSPCVFYGGNLLMGTITGLIARYAINFYFLAAYLPLITGILFRMYLVLSGFFGLGFLVFQIGRRHTRRTIIKGVVIMLVAILPWEILFGT